MALNNLITRTITGAILVALLVASIIIHPLFFLVISLIIVVLSLYEFYQITSSEKYYPQYIIGITSAIILIILNALISYQLITNSKWLLINILPIIIIPFSELFRNKKEPLNNVSITLFSILYIVLPFILLNYFFQNQFEHTYKSYIYLLSFFFFIWINDTMAYVSGKLVGKHALFPRISPKKTWEGTIGGIIFTLLIAYLIAFYTADHYLLWIGFALSCAIPAIFADLFESMIKRSLQIKDSGNLIPGHGGFLDRFDAVFLSAPIAFVYLHYICK